MALKRLSERSPGADVTSAVDANKGAAGAGNGNSVQERVAAIRAKAAELNAAHSPGATTQTAERPAQVAWNDWKND